MSAAKHYVVYIRRREDVSLEQLVAVMDRARGWFRVGERFWVLYSTSDAQRLYSRLAPLVKDSGIVFVGELHPENRQGWMTEKFWTWLRREESVTED